MRLLIICTLVLLASCSKSEKSNQVQVVRQAKYAYGQSVFITEGQYKGCTGTIGAAKIQDGGAAYKYDIFDLSCEDKSRHEDVLADIPENQIGQR